ncbi:MAG: hypothetical protein IJ188_04955 [Clostridia bacterium]|nr:hypothetical protein [Clostridia bacterium]
MSGKLLPALGASLWILGLVMSIVGLNIHTPTGSWISIVGNIAFLVGLGLEGVWWVRRRKGDKEKE